MADEPAVMYCPRCDRPYTAATEAQALEKVKTHVAGQHPDHDPNWWDTYPHDQYGN